MDKLDEHIIKCKSIENIFGGESTIASWLIELKQRRESDLRPADKFLGNTINRQVLHVNSELGEIQDAIFKIKNPTMDMNFEEAMNHIAEEIADAQMSLETLFVVCGFDEQQRREARRKVIEKNEARHYYRKGEK